MSHLPDPLRQLFAEVRRRRIIGAMLSYMAVAAFVVLAAQIVLPRVGAPASTVPVLLWLAVLGIPVNLVLSWVFDLQRTRPAPPSPRALRHPGVFVSFTGATVLMGVGAWWLRPGPVAGRVSADAATMAVVPFLEVGSGVTGMGDALAVLLAAGIDRAPDVRTVDPGRLFRTLGPTPLFQVESAPSLARRLGATSALTGRVTGLGTGLRLDAELHSAEGELLARARAEGPADALLPAVDSLATRLLRDVWRSGDPPPTVAVAEVTTSSTEALQEFLRGEAFFRRSEWDSAAVRYGRATAADSTFALAYRRQGQIERWRGLEESPEGRAAAERAYRLRARLPDRDRRLERTARLLGTPEGVDSARAFLERYPDDGEGWFEYADHLLHRGGRPGRTVPSDSVLVALERALVLDPALRPALPHAFDVALRTGDRPALGRLVRAARASGWPAGVVRAYQGVAGVLWDGRLLPGNLRPLLDSADAAGTDLRRAFAAGAVHRGVLPADEVIALALPPGRTPARLDRAEAARLRARLLWATGRWQAARPHLEELASRDPARHAGEVLAASVAGFAPPGAWSAAARADGLGDERRLLGEAVIALGHGDVEEGRRLVGRAAAASTGVRSLAEAVLGWADALQGDAETGVQRMADGLRSADPDGPLVVVLDPVHGRLAAAQRGALVAHLEEVPADGSIEPVGTLTRLAALHAAEGDTDAAADALRRALRVLDGADPAAQPRAAAISGRLAELGAGL